VDQFKPTTYTKKIDGQVVERTSATPAEGVQLVFDGWVEKTSSSSRSSSSGSSS
jgi:hypothetical protein